jgi:hypothetical protein
VGREIASNRDEDMPTLIGVTPGGELPDARLQHLIRMETGIFAQYRTGERGDQRLRGMAERERPCDQRARRRRAGAAFRVRLLLHDVAVKNGRSRLTFFLDAIEADGLQKLGVTSAPRRRPDQISVKEKESPRGRLVSEGSA